MFELNEESFLDIVASDYLIVRSFPISSLIREKKLSGQFRLDNSNICLHNGIQLRSATFQVRHYFDHFSLEYCFSFL